MKLILSALLFAALALASAAGGVRFEAVDLFVDTGERPLAAYQVELTYDPAALKLAGLEGGEGPFAPPPYYDPRGLTAGRVVIAAFTTDPNPPAGRIRAARVHVMVEGDAAPDLSGKLVLAATVGGERVGATLEVIPSQGGQR